MEFPFGHHHHHHHRRPEDREEESPNTFPPPGHRPHSDYDQPPPSRRPPPHDYCADAPYGRPDCGLSPPPSFLSVQRVSHEVRGEDQGGYNYAPPDYGHTPPPPFSALQHVSHEVQGGGEGGYNYGHHQRPGFSSSYVQHVGHEGGGIAPQQTVRVFTRADENYSLSIRDGKVVLARANPRDEIQHWIKDMRYSTKVKDEEGLPSFALINKVTGEALKHAIGATHPVRLVPYNPNYLDESVLWTESHDTGEGFQCIRMVNNIRLNFDAFHGDEDHGGVHDGTTVVLWEWLKGKNQRWKIVPY